MLLSQRPLTASDVDASLAIDRSGLIEQVTGALRRGRNTLVLGESGSGRTSLLQMCAAKLRAFGYQVAIVDAEPWETCRELVKAIESALGQDRREQSFTYTVGPYRSTFHSAQPVEHTVPRQLNETDLQTLGALAKRGKHWVVILDNLFGEFGHDLFGRFRDVVWPMAITWVAAVDSNDGAVLRPPADVFWEKQVSLGPLAESDVRKIIARRVDVADQDDPDVPVLVANVERITSQLVAPTPRDVIAAMAATVDGEGEGIVAGDATRMGLAHAAGGRRAAMALYELEALGRPAHAGDHELVRAFGLSRARISQLLNALESARLIRSFDQGRRRLYEPVAAS